MMDLINLEGVASIKHCRSAPDAVGLLLARIASVEIPDRRVADREEDDKVYSLIATMLELRLAVRGSREEISLEFDATAAPPCLVSPHRLVQAIDYAFRGATILTSPVQGVAYTTNGDNQRMRLVLRVTNRLVTFGGHVVWQASDATDS